MSFSGPRNFLITHICNTNLIQAHCTCKFRMKMCTYERISNDLFRILFSYCNSSLQKKFQHNRRIILRPKDTWVLHPCIDPMYNRRDVCHNFLHVQFKYLSAVEPKLMHMSICMHVHIYTYKLECTWRWTYGTCTS